MFMLKYVELIYIFTIFISVAAFSIHITARLKQLSANSQVIKLRSTTRFLLTVLLFNFSDFLIIYLSKMDDDIDISAIYVFENVLEIALCYFLICIMREYLGEEVPRTVDNAFILIAVALIYADGIYEWPDRGLDGIYFRTMLAINAVPVLILIYYSIESWRKSKRSSSAMEVSDYYLLTYNIFCIMLSIVCIGANADAQTYVHFFSHSQEAYVIMWLIFNVLNFVFVWKTILVDERTEYERETSTEECMRRIAEAYGLSDREAEIGRLIYDGMSNSDISELLYISLNTVKAHTSNLYRKLNVANRVQAVQVLRGEKRNEDSN